MKVDYRKLQHFCFDLVFPAPVWNLSNAGVCENTLPFREPLPCNPAAEALL